MKDLGLKVGDKLTQRAVDQIPGRALVEINKRIGARLAAKLGGQVVTQDSKSGSSARWCGRRVARCGGLQDGGSDR